MSDEGRNRRSWKSIRLTARFFSRYFALWALSSAVPILALNLSIYLLCKRLWLDFGDDGSRALFTIALAVETFSLLVGMMGLYLIAMHRIAGPYINLINTLGKINNGDLSTRIRFRKEDRLDDIAAAFNKMLDRLTASAKNAVPAAAAPSQADRSPVDELAAAGAAK
jgi:methyl-accepting chemotaxis protein